VRLFILSDSPPEKDVQWSEEGMAAAFKFIQKLWNLHIKILEKIKINNMEDDDKDLDKITNKFIKNVSDNLTSFSYNKIIANLHEAYNQLFSRIDKNYTAKTLIRNYEKILVVMMPVIPHFANECFENINQKNKVSWPEIDESFLIEKETNFVVQINGKKRAIIKTKKDISESELINHLYNNSELDKYIKDKQIIKKIFVPNKLINIIV